MSDVKAKVAFESWVILELFGHKQLAGLASEAEIGGCSFVRIDVPKADDEYVTHYYGQGAIYGMHPVDEQVAREFAQNHHGPPVSPYSFPFAGQQALQEARSQLRLEDGAGGDREENPDDGVAY